MVESAGECKGVIGRFCCLVGKTKLPYSVSLAPQRACSGIMAAEKIGRRSVFKFVIKSEPRRHVLEDNLQAAHLVLVGPQGMMGLQQKGWFFLLLRQTQQFGGERKRRVKVRPRDVDTPQAPKRGKAFMLASRSQTEFSGSDVDFLGFGRTRALHIL